MNILLLSVYIMGSFFFQEGVTTAKRTEKATHRQQTTTDTKTSAVRTQPAKRAANDAVSNSSNSAIKPQSAAPKSK